MLLNKCDLTKTKERSQQKALWIQKIKTLLAQKDWRDRTVTFHCCSAKTGEGIEAAFEALFTHRVEKENNAHQLPQMVLMPAPVSSPGIETAKPLDLANTRENVYVLNNKKPSDSNWRKMISKLLKDNRWGAGNLFIFILTMALLAAALLPVAGGLSMIGVLPAWIMCLLLGSFVLLGWNMGCALYHHYHSNDDPLLFQTSSDEAEPQKAEIVNSAGKKAGLLSQLIAFWSSPTHSVSSSTTQSPSPQNTCQNTSHLNS